MRACTHRVFKSSGLAWCAPRTRCVGPRYEQEHTCGGRRCCAASSPHAAASSDVAVRSLALLLLLHENLHRRTGRHLLPDDADLMKAVKVVGRMDCAVALCGCPRSEGGAVQLMYANEAAVGALQLGDAVAYDDTDLVQLPDVVNGIEVAPLAPCVLSNFVHWSPCLSRNGSSGGGDTSGSSGSFEIDRLLVCPVTAPNDSPVGVALLFDAWRYADGSLGRPGFPRVAPSELPNQQRLQVAADGVRQQADHVRVLKQQQGLSNQHPEVVAAVAELQVRKAALAQMEGLAAAFDDSVRQGAGVGRWLPLPVLGENS